MKLIVRLGLMSLVSLSAMATLGAAGAAAANETVLCKTNQATCAAGNQYAMNTEFQLLATNTLLKTAAGNISCSSSKVTNKITAQSGLPLPGKIEELVFSTCSWNGNGCSVTAISLAWESQIEWTANPDGLLTFAAIAAEPRLAFSCAGGTYKCVYGKIPPVVVHGGDPAEVIFSEAPLALKVKEGTVECPATIAWSGTYVATNPKPVYVILN